MEVKRKYIPQLCDVEKAAANLVGVVKRTPLMKSLRYSRLYACHVSIKREDLQRVRSYKIRGAYNKMFSLNEDEITGGIVCASAGNHAQGVALTCKLLKISGTIYMPVPTPRQKVQQVQLFGGDYIRIVLIGDNYDDSYHAALAECKTKKKTFIHPFNDKKTIEGQATVGLEIVEQAQEKIDYIFVPVGGGGLSSGISVVVKQFMPEVKIIGVEPEGASAMKNSIGLGENSTLESIDSFVDGAAVKRVGDLNFDICKDFLDEVVTVPNGRVCQTILDLYNRDAIVAEPAGALALSALELFKDEIKGKNVVCILSGGNNDITRMEEIKERALLYAGLKHYFIVKFPQRSGALREFVVDVLGPTDDISHFEYTKRNSRIKGSAVVGIELKQSEDLDILMANMKSKSFFGEYLNNKPELFQYLI